MSPYVFTLLADEASLLVFSVVAALAGAFLLADRRYLSAAVLLGASGLVAAGVVPVVGTLLSGDWLADELPGLALAEVVPWAALALLVFVRRAPATDDVSIDAASLLALGLAIQGLAGFGLGLGLLAQRWLAPSRERTGLLAAVGVLGLTLLVDLDLGPMRDALGRTFGWSTDANVIAAHLVVSLGEAAGWAGVLGLVVRRPRLLSEASASRGVARHRPRP